VEVGAGVEGRRLAGGLIEEVVQCRHVSFLP
jgi:hypothetical protein